jgi:hypothetical protein
MASSNINTNLSKRRNSLFSHFLAAKNLSIFRDRSPTTDHTMYRMSKEPRYYNSQININTEPVSIPICISRGWLKRRSQRPFSLDLDRVKDILINNDGYLINPRPKRIGTILDYIFI